MNDLEQLVAQGQQLLAHALRHGVTLSDAVVHALATADAAALAQHPADRLAFLAAFAEAGRAVGTPAAELAALATRNARLRPQVAAARTLLTFAAANGRKVDDETRNVLLATDAAAEAGTTTLVQEQAFLKAYEDLTTALAPITVETLEASTTTLPNPIDLWRGRRSDKPAAWTFGRFINAAIFIAVLAGTGVSLAYYSVGASALGKFRDLQASATTLKQKEAEAARDLAAKDLALRQLAQTAQAIPTTPAARDAAPAPGRQPLDEAVALRAKSEAELLAIQDQRAAVVAELKAIPERLGRWAKQPCLSSNPLFEAALCAGVDAPDAAARPAPSATAAPPQPPPQSQGTLVDVEAARTVVARMSEVYLPLLLGFLGAHAFILRRMSREIAERTFAKGSAFNHIVRTGLGALAGLASTWLLTPEGVGGAPLKALPTYALAFVAGYGIELVFAFMDRIIAAFTNPTK